MSNDAMLIRFPESNDAQANLHSRSLADYLNGEVRREGFQAEPRRGNPAAQDFGGSVALILGTAAVTEVAKGIKAWLTGHTGVNMDITTHHGHLILRNAKDASLADIVRALAEHGRAHEGS
jgi:hypothetical protein